MKKHKKIRRKTHTRQNGEYIHARFIKWIFAGAGLAMILGILQLAYEIYQKTLVLGISR